MKTELNILQTAFRLFLGKGFSDISTNEIIREAGTTKGGFYYCFKSREDLVGKVIETYLRPYYLQPLEEMRQAWENKRADVSTKTLLWDAFLRRSVSADSRKTLVWILPFGIFTSCFMKA